MENRNDNAPGAVGQHPHCAADEQQRTADCQSPEGQAQFAVDWQVPRAGSKGESQQCKIDGESKYDKRVRKNPSQAQWHARHRAERFAKRLGFLSSEQAVPSRSALAEQRATLLVVGGLGDVGQKHLQPALAELLPGIADCLDYIDTRRAAQ